MEPTVDLNYRNTSEVTFVILSECFAAALYKWYAGLRAFYLACCTSSQCKCNLSAPCPEPSARSRAQRAQPRRSDRARKTQSRKTFITELSPEEFLCNVLVHLRHVDPISSPVVSFRKWKNNRKAINTQYVRLLEFREKSKKFPGPFLSLTGQRSEGACLFSSHFPTG